MWVVLGYGVCALASATYCWRLYAASRHSLRSGRPDLFLQYWRYYGRKQLKSRSLSYSKKVSMFQRMAGMSTKACACRSSIVLPQ